MFRNSIWWPDTTKKAIVLFAFLAMIVLHQSELLGLMDATTLVFGVFPAQFAYDAGYFVVWAILLYLMYRASPEAPDVESIEEAE